MIFSRSDNFYVRILETMFCGYMSLFVALLFVLLTPGVLLTLPSSRSSLLTVAVVHGLVFGLVYHLTHKMVWKSLYGTDAY